MNITCSVEFTCFFFLAYQVYAKQIIQVLVYIFLVAHLEYFYYMSYRAY